MREESLNGFKRKAKAFFIARAVLFILGLGFFYYKYVPMVKPFQIIFLPILLATAYLGWKNVQTGTLFFIFVFPLINNLPYFFGIYEPIPHAPAALVLFLFLAFGILLRQEPWTGKEAHVLPVLRPLSLFAVLIVTSAVITFFRYANYFPFRGAFIYELTTNIHGVTAGGAIMSVVFESLNYGTGLALFMILLRILNSDEMRQKAVLVLGLSTLLSLAFAFVQHFGHPTLGNNPISIQHQLINGTFKDALSFGSYLSMAVPLFIGAFLSFAKILLKIVSLIVVAFSILAIFFAGSKSGTVSLILAAIFFLIIAIGWRGRARRRGLDPMSGQNRRVIPFGFSVISLSLILLLGGWFVIRSMKQTPLLQRFQNSKAMLQTRIDLQWKNALRMMADYPVTGVGLGGFIIEVANYSHLYKSPDIVPESAENYILQIGSELGLIGLILMIWIAWEIFKQMRRALSRRNANTETKYLLLGATAGALAFAVNAQAHSYIGSYEIKYMLWFLIGLIFSFSAYVPKEISSQEDKPSGATLQPRSWFRRKLKIAATVVIFLSGFTLLWNSTHSLSLASRTKQLGLKQEFGLDKLEKTSNGREFRWTREYGGLSLKIEKPVLVVPLHASHPDIQKKPVQVRIYLVKDFFKHKTFLKEITLSQNDWQDIVLSVPEDVGQEAILLIKVSRTWNPLETTGVPDPRNLGVAVGKVTFRDK
jgi:hypothetical protein